MTVLVVGASGATGRLLVEQLLSRGIEVKIVVRSPDKLPETIKNRENLALIRGSILELSGVEEPIEVSAEDGPAVVLEEGAVVYRSGMTMEDLEGAAIAAALVEVRGNRRKAAQMLAIGERTLYRKIKKFGMDEEHDEKM